jgi:hypothetical protein
MAETVRQPIDIVRLSTYIKQNVAQIALPISLKQVIIHSIILIVVAQVILTRLSLAMDSLTQRTRSRRRQERNSS